MKESPKDRDVKHDMRPGAQTLDGYLGDDNRALQQIIDDDKAILQAFNIEAKDLVKVMRKITRAGTAGIGNPVEVDGYSVIVDEWMGWLGCPFKDARRAAKRNSAVTNLRTGETMNWSDLHMHLIEEHSFFQGKGSGHRLEPEQLIKFLGLDQVTPDVPDEDVVEQDEA